MGTQKFLFFPASGNSKEAINCLGANDELIALIDDDPQKQGTEYCGYPIRDRAVLDQNPEARLVIHPGSAESYLQRQELIDQFNAEQLVTLIHPSAQISKQATIGKHVLIMAGVVITADAKIGDHCCILSNSVIHHDTEIGPYTMIAGGCVVAGFSKIGAHSYIGAGSTIRERVTLGDRCLVGMGSAVLSSYPEGSRIVGTPAKPLPKKA